MENNKSPKPKESAKPLRQPAEYGTLRRSIIQKAKNAFNFINQSDTINIKHKSASDVAENIDFGDTGSLRYYAQQNKNYKAKDIGFYENQRSVNPIAEEFPAASSQEADKRKRFSIFRKALDLLSRKNQNRPDLGELIAARNQLPEEEMNIPENAGLGEQIAARNQSPTRENNILAKKDIDSPLDSLKKAKNKSVSAYKTTTKAVSAAAKIAGPVFKGVKDSLAGENKLGENIASRNQMPNQEIITLAKREQAPKSNFDSQFSNKQSLKTAEGNLTFVEIKPEVEAQDSTPILVLPGWGITLNTERPLLKALHDSGKPTIAVEIPRFGGKVLGKDEIPAEIVRQAELIARKLSQLPEGEKIDIVGQSMAGMSLLAAAKIEPGILSRIRNVVLTSPVGISGNDNFAKLLSRFLAQHVPQDAAYLLRGKWNIAVLTTEVGKYMRNPVRTLKEAVAISQSEDYDALQILRDNGVKVALMLGQSDKLSPADKLWDRMGEGRKPMDQFAKVDKTEEGEDPKAAYEQRGATPSGFKYTGPVSSEQPPFDALTMVSGGHDNRIYADSEKFALQILKRIDFLNRPTPSTEQVVKNIKWLQEKPPIPEKVVEET